MTVNETKRWEINMLKRPLVIATIAATVAMTTFPTQASAQGDPLLGALVGAGIGAAIGHGVNGRNHRGKFGWLLQRGLLWPAQRLRTARAGLLRCANKLHSAGARLLRPPGGGLQASPGLRTELSGVSLGAPSLAP